MAYFYNYVCDRCGKEVGEKEVEEKSSYERILLKKEASPNSEATTKGHLCDSCKQDFLRFMDGKQVVQ